MIVNSVLESFFMNKLLVLLCEVNGYPEHYIVF